MIRVLILWHMHQPFYKDLVSGEYRLPWVRLHALKDYYGMVRLLDEFPAVHQTFNLVPSLLTQIDDYASGSAHDPFLDVAARPASDLSEQDRRFTLQYLFQANATHLIGRYPRYAELWERFRGYGFDPTRAAPFFTAADFTDLQVLSQIAWFDEFFLDEPAIAGLIRKERHYSLDDQRFIVSCQRELVSRVVPAYRSAADRGLIEISTSPFYHPILPLVCDTDQGAVSSPGLPLPRRFTHPEDARAQIVRGLDLHRHVFGRRPLGMWPSEGSVSAAVVEMAAELGIQWMATDEGVLGRSLGTLFQRRDGDRPTPATAAGLYTIYRHAAKAAPVHLVFRDHVLSDLVGFVYSSMAPQDAARDLVARIKEAGRLVQGRDPVIPVILDGENAWEYYPRSGREFLRRFYAALAADSELEAVTVAEAIARQREFAPLAKVTPGSWINANFNVWIGAPEDNRAWDHLSAARDFYAERSAAAPADKRSLAYEELLIGEGSDWNWWYGPEHHSANDREFDELYRKHLSNVYQLLGGDPPEALAQPIARAEVRPYFVPQTAYIRPKLWERVSQYFDWLGAAVYSADRSTSAMHGRKFFFDAVQAGIDESSLYVKIDFAGGQPPGPEEFAAGFQLVLAIGVEKASVARPSSQDGADHAVHSGSQTTTRIAVDIADRKVSTWSIAHEGTASAPGDRSGFSARAVAGREGSASVPAASAEKGSAPQLHFRMRDSLEVQVPLAILEAALGDKLHLRVTMWREHLPIDALPLEGGIDLDLVPEPDLAATGY